MCERSLECVLLQSDSLEARDHTTITVELTIKTLREMRTPQLNYISLSQAPCLCTLQPLRDEKVSGILEVPLHEFIMPFYHPT